MIEFANTFLVYTLAQAIGAQPGPAAPTEFVPTADDITKWTGLGVALVIAVVGLVMGMIRSVVKTTTRERTKREIAAYVAEGSITPDQAERIIAAGESPSGRR